MKTSNMLLRTSKIPVNTTYGVYFMYPKVRVWVVVKEEENMIL